MEEPQLSSALARDYKQCIYADRLDQHPGKWIGCASQPLLFSLKRNPKCCRGTDLSFGSLPFGDNHEDTYGEEIG